MDQKPVVQLSGQDGNVFNLISIVRRVLKEQVSKEKAEEFTACAMQCSSYDEVLFLIQEYVDVV